MKIGEKSLWRFKTRFKYHFYHNNLFAKFVIHFALSIFLNFWKVCSPYYIVCPIYDDSEFELKQYCSKCKSLEKKCATTSGNRNVRIKLHARFIKISHRSFPWALLECILTFDYLGVCTQSMVIWVVKFSREVYKIR